MRDGNRPTGQNPPAEKPKQTPEQLADAFATQAVKAVLAPDPDGLHVLDKLARIIPGPKTDPAVDLRSQIDDLDQRIVRQQRRVEKIIIERLGPREDMQAQLDDMIQARDTATSRLSDIEKSNAHEDR
jgi:deoxyadenosine/deoxycytidine kinase